MSASFLKTSSALAFLALLLLAAPLHAQVYPDTEQPVEGRPGNPLSPPTAGSGEGAPAPALANPEAPSPSEAAANQEGSWSIHVRVQHGNDDQADLADLPVLLHAVRPRGPFESGAPVPLATWASSTDETGLATFTGLPEDLAKRGLRLQANTAFGGISFDSAPARPADQLEISSQVYDLGHDLSGLRILQKRVVVEPWEEYLIFSQFWTVVLDADHAVDIGLSPDPALQRGLPLRLPIQAEGIHFTGPGQHEVINNVIFWNGVLQPNQPVSFQIRFSKSARASQFTYRQTMEFPVDEVQLIAPLHTQYQRVPRLQNLALAAPGFQVSNDASQLGLRGDMDFLVATGRSVEANEAYSFRLEGLPFRRPIGGWSALLGGLLGVLLILAFARREYKLLQDGRTKEALLSALSREKEQLLQELANLRREIASIDEEDEEVAIQLEDEEALLRERLALILRRLRDLQATSESN